MYLGRIEYILSHILFVILRWVNDSIHNFNLSSSSFHLNTIHFDKMHFRFGICFAKDVFCGGFLFVHTNAEKLERKASHLCNFILIFCCLFFERLNSFFSFSRLFAFLSLSLHEHVWGLRSPETRLNMTHNIYNGALKWNVDLIFFVKRNLCSVSCVLCPLCS